MTHPPQHPNMCIRYQPAQPAVELVPWAVVGVHVMVQESSDNGVIESVDDITGSCEVCSYARTDTLAHLLVHRFCIQTLDDCDRDIQRRCDWPVVVQRSHLGKKSWTFKYKITCMHQTSLVMFLF